MRAQRWLYHASPPERRARIALLGLRPGTKASYGPPAVYLFRSRLFAENYVPRPMDVWKVDLAGTKVYEDPEDPIAAVFTLNPVAVSRLTFLGTYTDGEPCQI